MNKRDRKKLLHIINRVSVYNGGEVCVVLPHDCSQEYIDFCERFHLEYCIRDEDLYGNDANIMVVDNTYERNENKEDE